MQIECFINYKKVHFYQDTKPLKTFLIKTCLPLIRRIFKENFTNVNIVDDEKFVFPKSFKLVHLLKASLEMISGNGRTILTNLIANIHFPIRYCEAYEAN
jgi:hypothetical protein